MKKKKFCTFEFANELLLDSKYVGIKKIDFC